MAGSSNKHKTEWITAIGHITFCGNVMVRLQEQYYQQPLKKLCYDILYFISVSSVTIDSLFHDLQQKGTMVERNSIEKYINRMREKDFKTIRFSGPKSIRPD